MKYKDGFMIHTGQPKNVFISAAVRHLELRQGIMDIKVKIMLPTNPAAATRKGFVIPFTLPDSEILKNYRKYSDVYY